MTFSGKHAYPLFEPNHIHKHVGCDSGIAKIIDYHRYAVKSEQHVKEALEFLDNGKPSKILDGLYHGGFKCQLYHDTLKELNVKCIINTSMGCSTVAKNWDKHVATNREFADVMDLNWQDDPKQIIEEEVLVNALDLIEETRNVYDEKEGGMPPAALVHCMQVP